MAFQRKKPAAIGRQSALTALASSIEKVPSGSRWIHEIKFDGYRVQIHLANVAVKISSAGGTTGPPASRRSRTTPEDDQAIGITSGSRPSVATYAPASASHGLAVRLKCSHGACDARV